MKAETLKKSILQLAVEGKLVPQIETEGTAKELLEKIREEKEQLIKEKKIKRDKNESVIYRENGHFYEKVGKKEPVCIDDEIPFDIPESWEWARIASIGVLQRGKGIEKSDVVAEGLPCIRYGELYSTYEDFVYCTKSYIDKKLFDDSFKVANDEVLMTLTGENKIDIGCAIANKTGHSVAFGGDMLALREHNMNGSYLVYAINSPCLNYQRTIMATGSIIIHLSASKIGSMLIPISPILEQQRIVEKIEEILPHIEEYNVAEQELTKLNKEFPEKMKQSVLQYAVEGKLVPQIETEGTAKELLEKIREEKEQLIKEKKIKKDKNESVIYREDGHFYEKVGKKEPVCIDDEIPFDIPDSWEWERIKNISYNIQYGYNAPAKEKGDIKMLRISDIHNNVVSWENVPYCAITENEIKKYLLKENDILFARTGGTVGKSYLVENLDVDAVYAGYLIRIQFDINNLSASYLKKFMESNFYWKQLKEGTIATAQPNCNGKKLGEMLIPIPPFIEQHRIVEKIEELLPHIEKYNVAEQELIKLN